MNMRLLALLAAVVFAQPLARARADAHVDIATRTKAITSRLIELRRHLHQHPELSNREAKTAELVARHLRELGLTVRTGLARTGVVGVLRGGLPGKTVALRADMDALPVTEQTNLPFKSQTQGVMHACGHDGHTAMLVAAAEVLTGIKAQIPGNVVFIFQGAEEGPPIGETGGASAMIDEGALTDPAPSAIFGLHVWPEPVGTITYHPGPTMAMSDKLNITVRGRQTHGGEPWGGVDPIVVASQIVLALQTIPSRQLDLTRSPAVLTIGSIHAGTRRNIIPDDVLLEGTIRTFDKKIRAELHARVRRTVEMIAASAGATAMTEIITGNPGTNNDEALLQEMLPTLERVAGSSNVRRGEVTTASEDFGFFQQKMPGLFLFLGIVPKGQAVEAAPRNHSPLFFVDEAALPVGVLALANLAFDWLTAHARP